MDEHIIPPDGPQSITPHTPADQLPEYVTIPEYAAFYRVGLGVVYDGCRRGTIPHRRIGRHIRIPRTELVR